jgi:hypothetical protein
LASLSNRPPVSERELVFNKGDVLVYSPDSALDGSLSSRDAASVDKFKEICDSEFVDFRYVLAALPNDRIRIWACGRERVVLPTGLGFYRAMLLWPDDLVAEISQGKQAN